MNRLTSTLPALILSSTLVLVVDGLDQWQIRTKSLITNNLNAVTYSGGKFVAVGLKGTIAWSEDGDAWEPGDSRISSHLWSVTYGPAGFVSVVNGGRIRTSTDGLQWVGRSSPTTRALFGVTYAQGCYVAVGFAGTILQSGPVDDAGNGDVIEDPQIDGDQFTFRFQGQAGQSYTLEAATTLGDWTTLTILNGTGLPVTYTVPLDAAPHRFFRLARP